MEGHTCVRLRPLSVPWSDGRRWGRELRPSRGSGDLVLPSPGAARPGPAPRGARQSVDLPGAVRRTRCSSSPFPSSLCLPRTPVLPAKPLSARS